MSLLRSTATVLAVLAVAACDDPAGPETRVDVGAVFGAFDEPEVTVEADGAALRIEVTTWGNPCTSRHHTDVDTDVNARTITVTPYDEAEVGFCFQSLASIRHEVTVTPGATGDWLVRVVGRRLTDPEGTLEVLDIEAVIAILIDNPNAP